MLQCCSVLWSACLLHLFFGTEVTEFSASQKAAAAAATLCTVTAGFLKFKALNQLTLDNTSVRLRMPWKNKWELSPRFLSITTRVCIISENFCHLCNG